MVPQIGILNILISDSSIWGQHTLTFNFRARVLVHGTSIQNLEHINIWLINLAHLDIQFKGTSISPWNFNSES